MKKLIVTADDFGLLKSINEGIVRAYEEGIVTYLNLIPTGEALDDAIGIMHKKGIKEAGAHLALTETRPVSLPSQVSGLVRRDGSFFAHNPQFFLRLFLGKIPQQQIYTELKSQLELLKKTGVNITSLSGHEHIHMMPSILAVFIKLAIEYKIPYIRYPRIERLVLPINIKKIYKALVLSCFGLGMAGQLKGSGVLYTDNFAGFLDSGSLGAGTLERILCSLREGTTELVCHPGFISPEVLDRCIFFLNCESELSALTSRLAKEAVKEESIELTTFGDLLSHGVS